MTWNNHKSWHPGQFPRSSRRKRQQEAFVEREGSRGGCTKRLRYRFGWASEGCSPTISEVTLESCRPESGVREWPNLRSHLSAMRFAARETGNSEFPQGLWLLQLHPSSAKCLMLHGFENRHWSAYADQSAVLPFPIHKTLGKEPLARLLGAPVYTK